MAVSRGGKPMCYTLFRALVGIFNQVFMIINWLTMIL